jgi:hypothetical protein
MDLTTKLVKIPKDNLFKIEQKPTDIIKYYIYKFLTYHNFLVNSIEEVFLEDNSLSSSFSFRENYYNNYMPTMPVAESKRSFLITYQIRTLVYEYNLPCNTLIVNYDDYICVLNNTIFTLKEEDFKKTSLKLNTE